MAARLAGPSTELGAVLELWRGVGLDGRREELDASALRIAEQQEASAANRKALAVASREWRKARSTDPEPLLKQFQQEVDNLTKRGRAAEQAFVSLYQALLEAPDPVPALAAAVQHAKRNAELELLNDKVRCSAGPPGSRPPPFRRGSAALARRKADPTPPRAHTGEPGARGVQGRGREH